MRVICFSSFTFGYLNRARVLFSSLRKHQPNWELVALITDLPPKGFTFRPEGEPFDHVVYAGDLGIDDFPAWLFKHDIVEACTAIKGPFLHRACQSSGADAIVYLDPDTCLFGSLSPIEEMLETWDIVLTPHLVAPDTEPMAILDNERSALKTGTYNLGFCAVRTSGDGAKFARWWHDRLLDFGYDDIPHGLFVDQRWCDLVPALFEKVKILRDPGYNVASWNLSQRRVTVERDGVIAVNGSPLRFWHFTKLGPIADAMTKRYARDNFPVYEIWNWYRREVVSATDHRIPARYWAYDEYDIGVKIEREDRLRYREDAGLQDRFPDPFRAGEGSYLEWLRSRPLDLTALSG